MKFKQGLMVCCLLCCALKVQAQYSMGNTGLLNIPTADMQEAGTFMGGGNYLPDGMTPFNFNTGNYFVAASDFFICDKITSNVFDMQEKNGEITLNCCSNSAIFILPR